MSEQEVEFTQMDRSWMKFPYTREYVDGLREFLALAENHLDSMGRTRCPCMKCRNTVFRHIEEVNEHVFRIGIQKDYNPWIFHGEAYEVFLDDKDKDDGINEPEELLEDIGVPIRTHSVVPNAQQEANPEKNEQPDVISHYKSMHHSMKKGRIAPRAEEYNERIVEMSIQPTEEGGDPLTANAIRKSVLGKRSGCGVVVQTRPTAAASGAAATTAARAEMDQLRELIQTNESNLRVIREQQISQQRQLDIIMARLNGSSTSP